MTADATDAGLRELHARGQAAWPEVALDFPTFAVLAAERLGAGPFDDVRSAELYLAIACAAGIDKAIAVLDRQYLVAVVRTLTARGHGAAAAADAVQTMRVRLLLGEAGRRPRIFEYDGRRSLASWLRVVAFRISISAHRSHHREQPGDIEIAAAEHSPELGLLQQQFRGAFDAAFRRAFRALTPRERNLLRHQVLDQLGIDRIAAIYRIHRATAARRIVQARHALIDGVRRDLMAHLKLAAEDLDSLLRLVSGNCQLSLHLTTPTPVPSTSRDVDQRSCGAFLRR